MRKEGRNTTKVTVTIKNTIVEAVDKFSEETGVPKSRIYAMGAQLYLEKMRKEMFKN